MSTSWPRCAAGLAGLGLLVTGCGGGSTADPSSGSPSGSSSGSSSSGRPQPRSTTGVTVDVLNWADFDDDPALLAYKQSLEALYGSVEKGEVLPGVRQHNTEAATRVVLQSLAVGRKNGWQVKDVIPAHVESAQTGSRSSTLRMCTWSPASSIYFEDGSPVEGGAVEQQWDREVAHLVRVGGHWRVDHIDYPRTSCTEVPHP